MNKKNKISQWLAFAFGLLMVSGASLMAQEPTNAEILTGTFETAITGHEAAMWALGAIVAGFVAVVVVIGLIIRGAKRVSSSS